MKNVAGVMDTVQVSKGHKSVKIVRSQFQMTDRHMNRQESFL